MIPFNPCGVAMDFLRSSYTRKMRFFVNETAVETNVRWYRCPPGAAVFTGHNLFLSGDWAYDKITWSGPGEILESLRTWSDGATPTSAAGKLVCQPDLFATGLTWPPTWPATHYDIYGLPSCCNEAIRQGGRGGGAGNGSAQVGPFVGNGGMGGGSAIIVNYVPVAGGGGLGDGAANDRSGYTAGSGGGLGDGSANDRSGYTGGSGGGLGDGSSE